MISSRSSSRRPLRFFEKEGADWFTTARVAAKAGVGVGPLYQYFPNKASILFRLQSDEWRQTSGLLDGILREASRPPLERLRLLMHAFIRSECDEAETRVALDEAAPPHCDAPGAREAKIAARMAFRGFLSEAVPEVPDAVRDLAAEIGLGCDLRIHENRM